MIFWLKYKERKVQRGHVSCSVKEPGFRNQIQFSFHVHHQFFNNWKETSLQNINFLLAT